MINEKITLNSAKNNVNIILKSIQGENEARSFEVTITDVNGVPVPLDGATVSMYIEKRDGNIVMLPGTVSGNSATFVLTLQASSVPGDNKVWVQIVEPGVMDLRADGAVLRVTPCDLDGAVESSSEFTALTELVASAASSARRSPIGSTGGRKRAEPDRQREAGAVDYPDGLRRGRSDRGRVFRAGITDRRAYRGFLNPFPNVFCV